MSSQMKHDEEKRKSLQVITSSLVKNSQAGQRVCLSSVQSSNPETHWSQARCGWLGVILSASEVIVFT